MQADGTAIYSNNPAVVVGENAEQFAPKMYQAMMAGHNIHEFRQTCAGEAELVMLIKIQIGDISWYLANGALERNLFSMLGPVRNNAILTIISSIIIASAVMLLLLRLLYQPIIQLRTTLAELAKGKGDLTQRLTLVNEHDDLGIITGYINSWIENTQKMMQDIFQLSQDLGMAIRQINQTSAANLETLDAHVKHTDRVVNAIEDLSSSSKDVTQHADKAAALAESANSTGQDSKEVVASAQSNVMTLVEDVRTTAQNVKGMSQKTKDISSITEVIGSVAEKPTC